MKNFLFRLSVISMLALTINQSFAHDNHAKADGRPIDSYNMHICAFHIAKDNPKVIIETQHYCMGLREDLFQCVLFETTDKEAKPKLLGVEYVISDEAYQKLSDQEKSLWHPHDYEVRQGLLALIGVTKAEDQAAMKTLVKT